MYIKDNCLYDQLYNVITLNINIDLTTTYSQNYDSISDFVYHWYASVQKVCTTEEHNGQHCSNKVKGKTDVPLEKHPNGLQ